MNKRVILLPFLMAGLLIGCNGKNAPAPTPDKEKEIWELDLVEGETSIEDIRATANAYTNSDASAEYFTARGTVVYNAGSTLAIYRNGHFLYCYNYNPTGSGVTEIAAHPLGSYVEVTGKIQNWSGPQMTAQPTSGTYDPDAKLTVLAEKGEEVAPVEVNTAAQFENAAATGVLAKVVYTADKDYELVANTSSHVQLAGEIEGMDKSKVSDPIVRCEKYVPAEVQTALFANNPKLEEGNKYYMVGVLAGTTKGSARLMIGEGSSWTLKEAKQWDEPTSVTITAAGSATSVEVGQQLQLTAAVLPTTARQTVTWSVDDEEKASVSSSGLVSGIAAGNVVVTATSSKNTVFGTLNLTIAPASKVITLVDSPVAGTKYKLGMETKNRTDDVNLYSTGTVDGNYGSTTANVDEAPDFELVAVSGGYNVKVTFADASVKYMNFVVSGKYTNVKFQDSATTVFTYNATAKTLFAQCNGHTSSSDDTEYYLGTYGTYTTLSCSKSSYITGDNANKVDVSQFPVHFYTVE